MMHKEVMSHHPSKFIKEAAFTLPIPLKPTNGLSCFFIEWDHALLFCFPRWYAKTSSAIWITIQAVHIQPLNLASPRTTPTGDEQRGALVGTF
jgi:hypothetical protein